MGIFCCEILFEVVVLSGNFGISRMSSYDFFFIDVYLFVDFLEFLMD